MVKHGRTKKRRAGRIGKTKLPNRNFQFFKPPQIKDRTVRSIWNPRKSPGVNLASMGLQSFVNSSIDKRGAIAIASAQNRDPDLRNLHTEKRAIELYDIPECDDRKNDITIIPGKTLAQQMLPVSIDDQKYISKCLAKHGENYLSMRRDTKTNDMQYTETKLRKMAEKFFLLTKDQMRVDIPKTVRHRMICCNDYETHS